MRRIWGMGSCMGGWRVGNLFYPLALHMNYATESSIDNVVHPLCQD